MARNDGETTGTWSKLGPLSSIGIGIVLILICLVLSFWVAFVALLIPVIVVVVAGLLLLGRQATPDEPEAARDPSAVGYQGPEAEYGVESESATGDPAS
ncbi:MAG TPA: hypothetical protein VFH44_02710 [Solirubrobacterales bacterium]|nr:hypothetical protein [Solirubrobacterales bacterium]